MKTKEENGIENGREATVFVHGYCPRPFPLLDPDRKKERDLSLYSRENISSLLGGGLRPIKLNFPRVQFRSNKKGGNNFLPILCVRAEPLIKINNAKHDHYLLLDSTRHSFDSGVVAYCRNDPLPSRIKRRGSHNGVELIGKKLYNKYKLLGSSKI